MNKKAAIPLLALLLAGCTTPVPKALSPQLVPRTFTGPIASDAKVWPEPAWWQSFGDAQMAALVQRAQDGNRDVAIAAARVIQAEAQSTIQR
jgi:outer membrane protein TolC